MTEPFDPREDIYCTRCHTTASWNDDGPPEDPDDRICHNCAWSELDALRAERVTSQSAIVSARNDIHQAVAALRTARDRLNSDRTGLADGLRVVIDEVSRRAWVTDSRGPYAWDDERYKAEAGAALRAIGKIARDALVASVALADAGVRELDDAIAAAKTALTDESIRQDATQYVIECVDETSPFTIAIRTDERTAVCSELRNALIAQFGMRWMCLGHRGEEAVRIEDAIAEAERGR